MTKISKKNKKISLKLLYNSLNNLNKKFLKISKNQLNEVSLFRTISLQWQKFKSQKDNLMIWLKALFFQKSNNFQKNILNTQWENNWQLINCMKNPNQAHLISIVIIRKTNLPLASWLDQLWNPFYFLKVWQ